MSAANASTWKISDPYSGEALGEIPLLSETEIDASIQKAKAAFAIWSRRPALERAQILTRAARILESKQEAFAQTLRAEAGKPIALARIEVTRAIFNLDLASSEARRSQGEWLRLDASAGPREGYGIVERAARGVILGITPFNFPLNLVIHKIAPALASGCTIVIKPSPFTPLTSLKILELFPDLLPGVLQILPMDDAQTARVTAHPDIAMVSFTGSAAIGWKIKAQAGHCPVTLELGGNAWCVIDESNADSNQLSRIAQRVALGAFGYAGQSCISVQNVAVHSSLWSEFKKMIAGEIARFPIGDSRDEKTLCSSVINRAAFARIQKSLDGLPKDRLLGEPRFETERQLIAPVAWLADPITHQIDRHPLTQEEVFAPFMTLRSYDDSQLLIQQINSSRYGLQCGIFTQDLTLARHFFREVEIGGLIVNDIPSTRYDEAPYGGVKDSGTGREGIRYAMEEMTYPKFMALSAAIP